jgi:outer membrane immunogenic protein
VDPAGSSFYTGAGSNTNFGWTAGAGVEHAFGGNWSVKAEYLYVDLGSFTYNSPNQVAPFTEFFWTTSVNTRFHVARVGLNWKFGSTLVSR